MDEGKNTTSTETEAQEGGLSNAQLEPPRLGNRDAGTTIHGMGNGP